MSSPPIGNPIISCIVCSVISITEFCRTNLMDDGVISNPSSPMQGVGETGAHIDGEGQTTTPNVNTSTQNANVRQEHPETGEDEVQLKQKLQKTSEVWNDFVVVTLKDGRKNLNVSTVGSGPTSTMARHLRSCLPHKEHKKNQKLLNFPPSDANVDSKFGKPQILIGPNAKYDANKMREAIANWLLCTEQPFKTMEDDMYVKMMKTANPLFEKVCRVTATSYCFKVYEHEKKKLKALTKAASKICLTTDCWKSSHQKIEYMVITGHFINQNWRLQKRVLSFMHVPPPRTGFDIAECIYNWEIEDKIFTISADNATYIDRAVKRLKEIFSRVRKLSCGGKLFHIRCCAHILNLLVKDGLTKIECIIEDVREGIKYINHSEGRRQTFSNVVHQLQIRDQKLFLDVPTRWNSTYDMLSFALKFKDAFPGYTLCDYNF
uniref:hAT-like transposase RNase-H fold domain-containing protein n=1 Tax=Lactuca sativa TaxID=4236 RepID=A0A9R1VE92_LACSA|nr:hypothetical protein LSAT_V11C500230960 [Lactuca sativa]